MANQDIVTPEALDILEGDIKAKGSVSEALLRKIAASLNAANYYSALPLGTILENFIPPTQFYDLASTAYVEINGQDITSTDYAQWRIAQGLDSGTVYLPDGRGMEFVQVNSGRNDGHENSVDVAAGELQDQRIQSHNHLLFAPYSWSSGQSALVINKSKSVADFFGGSTDKAVASLAEADRGKSGNTGSDQTNSKRIAVYRYIKVWNVAPDL